MRINVGIRRRLMPLVENSRRRAELLNMLLFSLPGTPIIYYGDEIGMGDNIYLGDRNGVRTPMQWSGDRNGGFSRADPARLYAPPIMDPVYGYQAINVEAQERFPFSLLNWMKRLVAMRKQHRVFGRGSFEFIYPANRKVLAYLRRDAHETILVVANLSRSLQPVELDLSAYAGLIPMEMFGVTEFPRITDRPYFLTLNPYGTYWFSLQHAPMHLTQVRQRAADDSNEALAASLPALLVGVDWEGVLSTGTRGTLERQALVPFLKRQRWFASKSREIKQARFADWTTIRTGSTPAFLALASVSYTDGWTETYLLPLAAVSGEAADRAIKEHTSSVLARVTGARKGVLVDGILDDDTCNRLLGLVEHLRELPTGAGSLRGVLTTGKLDLPNERRWTRSTSDQSNSVVFVNDRYVLKLFRRVEPGTNPEFELPAHLAKRGFTRIPPLGGGLFYHRPGLDPGTLAVVQGVVGHQGSGWEVTINDLRRYYEAVAACARSAEAPLEPPTPDTLPPFLAATERWYLASAQLLGRRTAEMHRALATPAVAAFAPEPFDAEAREATHRDMILLAEQVLDLLASKRDAIPDVLRPSVGAVLDARPALLNRLDAIRGDADAGMRIRIHGDYHLGQVLRTEEDFIILDFEGEPARSLAERRLKQPPLKDVAGMLRSFSYAAYAALFTFSLNATDDFALLTPWADAWQHWVGEAFLASYQSTAGAGLGVQDPWEFDRLLGAFILEKALYELGYELNNRPDWLGIPLVGILGAL
jgi:maltose alpha-D-glucosyltransferase/alpha-amylase